MRRSTLFALLLAGVPALAGDGGEVDLVQRYRKQLTLRTSSSYSGWPIDRALDGDPQTSWFSGSGDSAAKGTTPWLELGFPADVDVRRIEILGNREKPWARGYTIRLVRLELFDAEGKLLLKRENEGFNALQDITLKLRSPAFGVRRLRVTSLNDEGDQNPYGDIAIAELKVW
jgi:hypothetical protein